MPSLKRKSGSLNSSKNEPDLESNTAKSYSNKKSNLLVAHVTLLDDAQAPLEFLISKTMLGAQLFSDICAKLGVIIERDYFGLRFSDKYQQRQWLENDKTVYKQLKEVPNPVFKFRVKHYPKDPMLDFKQDISRYLLYLQIRRDMVHGRLLGTMSELKVLGALVVQAEFGDAPLDEKESQDIKVNEENRRLSQISAASLTSSVIANGEAQTSKETVRQFINRVPVLLNKSERATLEIIDTHLTLRGLTAKEAENELLVRASNLPTFGIDPFPVKPSDNATLMAIRQEGSPAASTSPNSIGGSISENTSATATSKVTPGTQTVSPNTSPLTTGNLTAPRTTPTSGGSILGSTASGGQQPNTSPKVYYYIGLTHVGVAIFIGLQRSRLLLWDEIKRVGCDRNVFFISLASKNKTTVLSFNCENESAAFGLWKWTVDRKCFFTLKKASKAKKLRSSYRLFSRTKSFRFSGMSQMELQQKIADHETIPQPEFTRVASLRRMISNSQVNSDSLINNLSGFSTFPRVKPVVETREVVREELFLQEHSSAPDVQSSAKPSEALAQVNEESGDHISSNIAESTHISTPVEILEPSIELVLASATMANPPAKNIKVEHHVPKKDDTLSMNLPSVETVIETSSNQQADPELRKRTDNTLPKVQAQTQLYPLVPEVSRQSEGTIPSVEQAEISRNLSEEIPAVTDLIASSTASLTLPSTIKINQTTTTKITTHSAEPELRLRNGLVNGSSSKLENQLFGPSPKAIAPTETDEKSAENTNLWSQLTTIEIILCLLCFTAMFLIILILEVYRDGKPENLTPESAFLSRLAVELRRQPIINAFEGYIYSPMRHRVVAVFGSVFSK